MDDVVSRLSARDLADLCAFADGTLPAERRAEVEARVAASPELLELVERQRRAVAATQVLAEEPVPASLRETVEARRSGREGRRARRWRLGPRLALVGGLAAVVTVVVAVVLSGGPGGPTVADAARLAAQPPNGPAPPRLGNSSTKLAVHVERVAFPYLARSYGWHARGVRRGRVDGRSATVVFYGKDGRRIAYVIVAGAGLPRPSGAQAIVRGGVRFQTLRLNGRLAVTWRRAGHTCVLTGGATRAQLLALASRPYGTPRH
jgi:hypothetical protein